jgi:hypothetical protein
MYLAIFLIRRFRLYSDGSYSPVQNFLLCRALVGELGMSSPQQASQTSALCELNER